MSNIRVRSITCIDTDRAVNFGSEPGFETFTDDMGALFRSLRQEYGKPVSAMFRDLPGGGVRKMGWVFQGRAAYDSSWRRQRGHRFNRGELATQSGHHASQSWYSVDKQGRKYGPGTFLRECWVEIEGSIEPKQTAKQKLAPPDLLGARCRRRPRR